MQALNQGRINVGKIISNNLQTRMVSTHRTQENLTIIFVTSISNKDKTAMDSAQIFNQITLRTQIPPKVNLAKSTYSIKSKLKGQTIVTQKVLKVAPQCMFHQDFTRIRCNSSLSHQSQLSVFHFRMTLV